MKILTALLSLFCIATTYAASPAKRVITLTPNATELAFSAGLGPEIVGVSDYSDYPKQAKNIERVANYQSINIERILALKPGLVIAWRAANPDKQLIKLKQLGVHIYYLRIQTLPDIATTIRDLSQYSADPKKGQQAAQAFSEQLTKLSQHYHTKQLVPYLYLMGSKPMMTMAKSSWPSPVFQFCGGKNTFADSEAPYPEISVEQVLVAQPQAIFSTDSPKNVYAMWRTWQAFVPAINQHHVTQLNADWLNRPTLRTLKVVQDVCQKLEAIRQNH